MNFVQRRLQRHGYATAATTSIGVVMVIKTKAINIGKRSHSVPTILDALRATVMDRVSLRVRQAKMFRRCKKKGLMGWKGENCRTFTEDFLFDLNH